MKVHLPQGLSVTEIAQVVNAALVEYDGDKPWGDLDERDQAILEHGVRVVQEGNDVPELYRQTRAAQAGDADLTTDGEWERLKPIERRRWYLFASIVESLSLDEELAI